MRFSLFDYWGVNPPSVYVAFKDIHNHIYMYMHMHIVYMHVSVVYIYISTVASDYQSNVLLVLLT